MTFVQLAAQLPALAAQLTSRGRSRTWRRDGLASVLPLQTLRPASSCSSPYRSTPLPTSQSAVPACRTSSTTGSGTASACCAALHCFCHVNVDDRRSSSSRLPIIRESSILTRSSTRSTMYPGSTRIPDSDSSDDHTSLSRLRMRNLNRLKITRESSGAPSAADLLYRADRVVAKHINHT